MSRAILNYPYVEAAYKDGRWVLGEGPRVMRRVWIATHCGPRRSICAACGGEIGAYESRQYGPTGAVHVYRPDCTRKETRHLYPHYYTDG